MQIERRRIQHVFLQWLDDNRDWFAVGIELRKRTDRYLEFAFFPDRPALWIDHLFEPFLEWVNMELAALNWLSFTEDLASATSGMITVDHPSRNLSKYRGNWMVLPVRNSDTRSASCSLRQE